MQPVARTNDSLNQRIVSKAADDQVDPFRTPSGDRAIAYDEVALSALSGDAFKRTHHAEHREAHQVNCDVTGRDLDATLGWIARDIARQVIRTGLSDHEEAAGIARRVGRI